MDTPVHLGLELPALGAPGGSRTVDARGDWRRSAAAAASAGWPALWVTGGPGSADGLTCDPCTLAAAAVRTAAPPVLGVVSVVPLDRHPAVLARDLTALDVVSGGRAAVLLRWGDTPAAPSDAIEHLYEAAAVCRSVLTGSHPLFEGRFLHVAGAVNRPPPVQDGGPPVLVQVPPGARRMLSRRSVRAALARLAASATCIVAPGAPGDVAAWRRVLDELRGVAPGRPPARPALLWHGPLAGGARDAAACRDAGADGMVAVLETAGGVPGSSGGGAALAATLEQVAEAWRH